MKKISITIGLFIILLTLTPFVTAKSTRYKDVQLNYEYHEAIDFVTQKKIVSGYPNGTYQPHRSINRAEILKIIIEAKYTNEFESYVNKSCFSDVPKNEWFVKYVCFAKHMGIIKGYNDNTFRPAQEVKFVEALKIAMQTFGYSYDESKAIWYEDLVKKASEKNLIPLDVKDFGQILNRGQMADMITRFMKEEEDALGSYLKELPSYVDERSRVTYETIQQGCLISDKPSCDKGSEDAKVQPLSLEINDGSQNCFSLANSNDINEKRINMVFVGVGYTSLDIAKEIANGLIDYTGEGNGLFSVEPYKSLKDEFNFWITEEIFYEEEHESFLAKQRYDLDKNGIKRMAKDNCPLDNAIFVSLVRYPNCTLAGGDTVWLSIDEDGHNDYKNNLIENQNLQPKYHTQYDFEYLDNNFLTLRYAPDLLHELGHVFGLRDEYINGGKFYESPPDDIKAKDSVNCFVAENVNECQLNAPWKDFIGQGSGYTKIGCYEGCDHYGKGLYRPAPRSLMGPSEGMYYPPGISTKEEGDYVFYEEEVKYGSYNEHLIKNAILDILK